MTQIKVPTYKQGAYGVLIRTPGGPMVLVDDLRVLGFEVVEPDPVVPALMPVATTEPVPEPVVAVPEPVPEPVTLEPVPEPDHDQAT